jgi:creatinine amidohydrolase/Fe(II)-dependent formamide hydrolase-like protein
MIVKTKMLLLLSVVILHYHSYCQATKSSKGQSVFIEEQTTFELSEKIKQGFTTVLIYSGGTEATGPHVALGKHNFRVRSYAHRIADSLGNTLIAPILPFAPNSEALQKWPGTFTLDSLTFSKVNEQIAMSMISSGFRHIIFLSDHFNSQPPLAALARKLDSVYHTQGIDVYYAADGYTNARAQIEEYIEKQQIVPGGHGGLWDVSETMAISKAYVRPALFAMGDTTKKGNGPLNVRGFSGDPTKATAKLGEQFAALRVKLYVDEIRRHLTSWARENSGNKTGK